MQYQGRENEPLQRDLLKLDIEKQGVSCQLYFESLPGKRTFAVADRQIEQIRARRLQSNYRT